MAAALVTAAALLACGCVGRPPTVRPEESPDFLSHRGTSAPGAGAPAAPAASPAEGHRPGASDARAPHTFEAGRSVEGRPLVVEMFGTGPTTTLVIGGVHGDEARGTEIARRLAALLRADPAAARGRVVAILAAANPDGAARRRRANADGVDLNRNFPAANWRSGAAGKFGYGGPVPASEPETQAIMRLVERLRPDRVIALHSTSPRQVCNNYDGPAGDLARLMAARNGYPVLANIGHPTPGSLGNWLGVDRGIPILTVELPEDAAADACWELNRQALLEAVSADAAPPVSGPISFR
jgi:protein MpaA